MLAAFYALFPQPSKSIAYYSIKFKCFSEKNIKKFKFAFIIFNKSVVRIKLPYSRIFYIRKYLLICYDMV